MSKTKHHASSASQRREQLRQERQQRVNTEQKQRSQPHGKRSRRSRGSNPWPMVGIVVLLVAIVIGVFVFIARQQVPSTDSATSTVWKTITSLDAKTFATVANGSADDLLKQTFYQVKSPPAVLTGANGKPEVFYMGAEFCPYCAGQRWALITALSRFGTFSKVSPIISSESSVPTYSFHGSNYTSQYIDFVPVEVEDQQGKALETLTSEQNAIVNKYDAPPYTQAGSGHPFPFVSIGNQVVVTGGTVDSSLLVNHSYDDIARQLQDSNSDIAKSVLGAANYFTAAICSLTDNQPVNVCGADPVPQLQISLSSLAPKAFTPASGSQFATAATLPELVDSRRRSLVRAA